MGRADWKYKSKLADGAIEKCPILMSLVFLVFGALCLAASIGIYGAMSKETGTNVFIAFAVGTLMLAISVGCLLTIFQCIKEIKSKYFSSNSKYNSIKEKDDSNDEF